MLPDVLVAAIGCPRYRAVQWADPIARAMEKYEINTPIRKAAFLAQIGVESGRLAYTREIWGPTKWQVGYEGNADLGNTQKGDGRKFCGRGLIQVTGRSNYTSCGAELGLNLVEKPELLELPQHAAMSAAWYWHERGLNELADAGQFDKITRRVNGPGMLGAEERRALFERAKAVV